MDAVVGALSDYPGFLPVVARWHWQEWGHTDPGGTPRSWEAGLARQADADQIPGTLVAVVHGAPVGAVCLVEHDMPGHEAAAGFSPWMKGLFVSHAERRRGYGALLVSRCEAWAAALGHESLYLYTERDSGAEQLYRRLGWQIIRQCQYDGMAVTVMRKNIFRQPAYPSAQRAIDSSRGRERPHLLPGGGRVGVRGSVHAGDEHCQHRGETGARELPAGDRPR